MTRSLGILGRQTVHELVSLLRTPLTMILSVAFPLVFFLLLAALMGNAVLDEATGVRMVQFLAPALASFGVLMATFSFLASGFAEAKATGVLKRQLGTPLPRWALIGGRVLAAVLLGFIAVALVLGVGVAFFDLQLLGRSIAAVVVTLLLSSVAFAALGLATALLLPSASMVVAVTNGLAIVLSFISGIFMMGGAAPEWMDTIAWMFPLKHMVALFSDGLNPYLTGSGFQWDNLAAIAAWGLAGALLALWGLRSGEESRTVQRTARLRVNSADATPRGTGRPSVWALLAGQVVHAQAILWRDPSSVFFAVVFPLLLVAIIPTAAGGGDIEIADGLLLGGFYAATMAIYGSAVTSFVNMPQGLAEDRERGVLKRTRGTPLPTGILLAGRVVAALVVSLLTLAAITVLAVLMYSPPLPPNWAVGLLVLVLSAITFSVIGLAVASLVHSAQAVLGATLGTLLPLCFISDIFVVGADLPAILDAIAWFFPLRHAARAMTDSVSTLGGPFPWTHLAVIAAWLAVSVVVIATRFRSEAVKDRRRGTSAARAQSSDARHLSATRG